MTLGDLARPEPWLRLRPEPYTAEEPRVVFREIVLADMAPVEERRSYHERGY